MKTFPKKWTQHHTHRLFHISLAAIFAFGAIAVLWGTVLFFSGAHADISLGTTPSLTVPGINPGPTTGIDEGTGSITPTPAVTPTTPPFNGTPYVSVIPVSNLGKYQTLKVNDKDQSIFVFNTGEPAFYGQTNLLNGQVTLRIDFSSGLTVPGYSDKNVSQIVLNTFADGDGNWLIALPSPIPDGYYTAYVYAQDATNSKISATASIGFYVNAAKEPQLPPVTAPPVNPGQHSPGKPNFYLSAFVQINPRYKTVAPGEEIQARIQVFNHLGVNNLSVKVQYVFTDATGKVAADFSEPLILENSVDFTKTFFTSAQMLPGEYTLTVKVLYDQGVAISSDKFSLAGAAVLSFDGFKADFTVIFEALIALLFLFLLVLYFEYSKIKIISKHIRQVNEHDLLPEIKK